MDIKTLLKKSVDMGASDLHLQPTMPPLARVHGDLIKIEGIDVLTPEAAQGLAFESMTESQQKVFENKRSVEYALHYDDIGSFRVSIYQQQKGITSAFRIIPEAVPSFDSLMLPRQLKGLLSLDNGLIVICGATGSGKSTTMAALIDYINTNRACNIITIEDPIEYIHKNKKSALNQLQVGRDTESFDAALRSSLRQDPDVILVGEIRDLETIRLALTASETGHLVITTLHARSASQAISRIIDAFPDEEKNRVRNMLSESIQAVIYQTLLKKIDGKGRIGAYEIMVSTPGIRHLIHREMIAQMETAIQTGSEHGMCTIKQYVEQLLRKKLINKTTAMSFESHKGSFRE